jgi:hypothetical protein
VVDEEEPVDDVELLRRGLVGDASRVAAVELEEQVPARRDLRAVLLHDDRKGP